MKGELSLFFVIFCFHVLFFHFRFVIIKLISETTRANFARVVSEIICLKTNYYHK